MRQVNTRFFFILLGGTLALAAGLFLVHRLQAGNITSALLWQADQAEKAGKADLVARYLGRYLEFVPEDIEQRARLAAVLADDKVAVTPAARRRAEFVINQVLAWDPQRHALRQSLCRILLMSRRLDAVKEHLDYLRARQPDSGEVAYLTGQWHEMRHQAGAGTTAAKDQERITQEARREYERAIEATPGKVDAYLRLVALLRQLDFGKEPKHAAEIDRRIGQALANAPDNAAVLSLAAQRAQEKGDDAAALKYLDAGLKHSPTEPRLYVAMARLHSQKGNRKEAISQVEKGLKAVGKQHQFELTWTLANLLLDDQQMDAARKVITQIRDLNQRSADYLEARCLMQQGRWFEAARSLERMRPAFKSVPELALQVDLYLGLCYQKIDDPVQQLAAFQRAARSDPTSLAARHGEALAYWAIGRRDEALARFQRLVLDNPNRPEAARWRLDYVRMLLQAGAPGEALVARARKELDEAEKDLPKAVECALLRAELLFLERDPAKAEAVLRRAAEADEKRFEPWVALAAMAMAQKRPAQAEKVLAEAGATVPDGVEFRIARAQFWAEHARDRAEMLAEMERDLARFSPAEQARLLEALAAAHHRAGRPAQAVRLLRQLAALPGHAEDVRVRMQWFAIALEEGDEPQMQRALADVKNIEGDAAAEGPYGEALRLIWRARRGQKGELDRARALLTTAAARRPDWPPLLLARAEIDALQGKTDQAIGGYRRAIELGSRDAQALYQLVLLLSKAQRFEEAEQEIRKMKQIERSGVVGKFVVAVLYNDKDVRGAGELARKLVRPQSKDYHDHLWLGQVLVADGRASAEAEAAFREAVTLGGRQPETWVALVRYLANTGQFGKALDEIGTAGKVLDDKARPLALAQCYDALGALDRAEQGYRTTLAQQPDSVPAHRAAADFFLRLGKPRDAEPILRRLLDGKLGADEADVTAARRGLALVLARSGDPRRLPEALQLVGLALDDAGNLADAAMPAAPDAQLAQARVLAALGSHALRARAIDRMEQLHARQLLPIEDQYQLARLLHLHGPDPANWQKARAVLKGIQASRPNDPRYVAFHTNLLLLHKEVPEAENLIAHLEQIEKDRNLPRGVLGSVELRARALELRGKELQAVTLLQDFAAQKDAPPARTLLLASLHARIGNYADAIDLCDQVRALGYREEAYGAAIGMLRAGKPAEAQKVRRPAWQKETARVEANIRHSLELDPDNVVLRLQLADLMELVGRFDEVERVCRDILAKDSHSLVALNNLAWLLAGKDGRGQEALSLIQKAIAEHGNRPELLDTRAIAYVSLGMPQEAVRDLEKVVREAPTPARYFHLVRAHHLAKNAPQAQAALQRANELGLTLPNLHPIDQAAYSRVIGDLNPQ